MHSSTSAGPVLCKAFPQYCPTMSDIRVAPSSYGAPPSSPSSASAISWPHVPWSGQSLYTLRSCQATLSYLKIAHTTSSACNAPVLSPSLLACGPKRPCRFGACRAQQLPAYVHTGSMALPKAMAERMALEPPTSHLSRSVVRISDIPNTWKKHSSG